MRNAGVNLLIYQRFFVIRLQVHHWATVMFSEKHEYFAADFKHIVPQGRKASSVFVKGSSSAKRLHRRAVFDRPLLPSRVSARHTASNPAQYIRQRERDRARRNPLLLSQRQKRLPPKARYSSDINTIKRNDDINRAILGNISSARCSVSLVSFR